MRNGGAFAKYIENICFRLPVCGDSYDNTLCRKLTALDEKSEDIQRRRVLRIFMLSFLCNFLFPVRRNNMHNADLQKGSLFLIGQRYY